MMRVLATGGAGFIGSHLVRRLLQEGCEVMNIDKLTYAGSLSNLGSEQNHPKHRFEKVDICDERKIKSLIADFKPEKVIHMAAESHVDRSIDDPGIFIQTNVVGTQNIVHGCYTYWKDLPQDKQSTFRFVHLSTDEVFGTLDDNGFFDENSPYLPNSPYSASKASSDLIVRGYCKTYGFPAVIINSSNNYGPHQFPEKLIPLMILNALEEKPLPVYGEGKQIRDWLFVEDHVDALWLALSSKQANHHYCIGGGNEIRNIDIVNALCTRLDETRPLPNEKSYLSLITYVKDRPGHDYRYANSFAKIKKDLGWNPKTKFQDGLHRTIDWYIKEQENLIHLPARARKGTVK